MEVGRRKTDVGRQKADVPFSVLRFPLGEVSNMGRTIAQTLIEEGMEIGVEKGIIQTNQERLIELIQFRFPSIRHEINDKIRSIQDVDRLTVLFRRALSINSIDELSIE